MGQEVCRAVQADPDLDLVAAVDPGYDGIDLANVAKIEGSEVRITGEPRGLADAGVDVAVDFTEAGAARANIGWMALHGIHAVVGTTGFSDDDLESFRTAFSRSNCVIAPNFAIGAVLLMRFAQLAAPYFDTGEVIELHHDKKIDAPSGTAMHTAALMAEASAQWADDPTEHEVLSGARGGPGGPDGRIRVHSVRMRGMVAHQEVILGTTGQTLTLRHDSYDRSCFMPGVLLAVKAVGNTPGVTVGLDRLLDL